MRVGRGRATIGLAGASLPGPAQGGQLMESASRLVTSNSVKENCQRDWPRPSCRGFLLENDFRSGSRHDAGRVAATTENICVAPSPAGSMQLVVESAWSAVPGFAPGPFLQALRGEQG